MSATSAAVESPSVSEAVAPPLNLQDNDFQLFGLPQRFSLDRAALDERWKNLQRQVHPDRFTTQGAAAQRVAMQWSVRINEAYNRLKDPLKRAAYWCELQGEPVNAESNTSMPASFLMQQMEWREALDDAQNEDALDRLLELTRLARQQVLDTLTLLIDQEQQAKTAVQQVRALMFIERFAEEVQKRLETF